METIARKERKENSCFNRNKRMLMEGYLFGKTGFPKITDEEVAQAEFWMNNYPRRIHGGKNPAMITDQYKLLKNDCNKVLQDCNNRVGEIKTDVLSFLRTCNEQNIELIKKIPEQCCKFSWLDVVVYAMCGVCIIGMIVQMAG